MSLKAYFLGKLDFTYKGKSISPQLSQKARGLLCYLIMNKSRILNRENLAELFWETSSKYSAKYNLRYTLWAIRKSLESSAEEQKYIILPGKNTCKFNSDSPHWVDVFEFIKLVDKGKKENIPVEKRIDCLEVASSLYKSDFLEGVHIRASSAFSDWVFYEKERLQKLFFESQLMLANIYESLKRYDKAIQALKRLVKINPLQEEIYYKLIRLYYIAGDRASAIKEFLKCKKTLREELNISPMKKTQRLYKKIVEENSSSIDNIDNEPNTTATSQNNSVLKAVKNKKKGLHMFFYVVSSTQEKQNAEKELNHLNTIENYISIDIARLPGKRIPYEGVMDIAESALKNIEIHNSNSLSPDPLLFKELKNSFEQYLVFQSVLDLLIHLAQTSNVLIKIHNIHWFDRETIDFLSFLYRKGYDKNLFITGIYDLRWKNPRFDYFVKAFYNEERIQFCNLSIDYMKSY